MKGRAEGGEAGAALQLPLDFQLRRVARLRDCRLVQPATSLPWQSRTERMPGELQQSACSWSYSVGHCE